MNKDYNSNFNSGLKYYNTYWNYYFKIRLNLKKYIIYILYKKLKTFKEEIFIIIFLKINE